MLPDMSSALSGWTQSVTLKTVTTTTIDFEPSTAIASTPIMAVVQPADKKRLNQDAIDWSLLYILVHSVTQLNVGQYIEYNGINFKLISLGAYGEYGYYEATGEQVRGNII